MTHLRSKQIKKFYVQFKQSTGAAQFNFIHNVFLYIVSSIIKTVIFNLTSGMKLNVLQEYHITVD